MKLELYLTNVETTPALIEEINKRLELALGRLSRRVEVVRVYLRDVNGPRGGIDMRCRVVVELPRRGRVVVSGLDPDLRVAISTTLKRAGWAVRRHFKQLKEARRMRRREPALQAT